MIQILYSELPEIIATCKHCIETLRLFPEEPNFTMMEEDYIENFDTATLQQLLEFDFRYELSEKYRVKTLVKAYRNWESSIEPFVVPEFNSWLGVQMKLLFNSTIQYRVTDCLKLNYCELLLALEEIYGFNWVNNQINTKIIYNPIYYAITNQHVEITRLVIDKYKPAITRLDAETAIKKGNLHIINALIDYLPKFDMLVDGISFEAFEYLVSFNYINLANHDTFDLLKLAVKQENQPASKKISMIEYIASKKEVDIDTIPELIKFSLNATNYQVAEYLLHKYKLVLSKLPFNHSGIMLKAITQVGNRDYVMFLVNNGIKVTNECVAATYEKEYLNLSPAFIKSLIQ